MKFFIITIAIVGLILQTTALAKTDNEKTAQDCSTRIQIIRDAITISVNPIKQFFEFGFFNAPNYFKNCPLKFVQYAVTIKPNITYTVNNYFNKVNTASSDESIAYLNALEVFGNKIKDISQNGDAECIASILKLHSPDVSRESYIQCIKQLSKQVTKAANKMDKNLNTFKANCNDTENIDGAIGSFTTSLSNGIVSFEQCVTDVKFKYSAAVEENTWINCTITTTESDTTESVSTGTQNESTPTEIETTDTSCAEKVLEKNTEITELTDEYGDAVDESTAIANVYKEEYETKFGDLMNMAVADSECLDKVTSDFSSLPIETAFEECTAVLSKAADVVVANLNSDLEEYSTNCIYNIDLSISNANTYLADLQSGYAECVSNASLSYITAYSSAVALLENNCIISTTMSGSEPTGSVTEPSGSGTEATDPSQSVATTTFEPISVQSLFNFLQLLGFKYTPTTYPPNLATI